MKNHIIIAVDGESGAGKSTLSQYIAHYFNLHYLNTGNLYRSLAFKVIHYAISLDSHEEIVNLARNLIVDEEEIDLKTETIAAVASQISIYEKVREALINCQRNFSLKPPGAVLEGRDIGTIICPNASIKLFLKASLEKRAKRRYIELQKAGNSDTYISVLSQLENRDNRDKLRNVAPLVKAEDAIEIDSSEMTIDELCAQVVLLVKKLYVVL